ncbi:MAG: hypothetical protein WBF79_19715, partial [Rhodococcus sp. (in: high G+C Gram-positive bacteria)]
MTAENADGDNHDASRARERRARLARVFGEVLPEGTRDDSASSESHVGDSSSASDEWFRGQR